ncbi:MAG TPA: hypothetical protein EYP62_06435 [Kiritimatiellae bacterium]|nr:hypothetical protein [Kiritimatiellia bacterium]
MINRICDMCGEPLDPGDLRYELRIEAFAAYDPLDITFDDLLGMDLEKEIARVADACRNVSSQELMRQVYTSFRFDLCPRCYRRYIRNPLPPAGQETAQK